jgi:hypothetical protein
LTPGSEIHRDHDSEPSVPTLELSGEDLIDGPAVEG